MSTFHLELVTPDGTQFESDAVSVVIPGVRGSWGVLARHAPMIGAVGDGVLKVETEGGTKYFVVTGGVAEIDPVRTVILADGLMEAENPGDAEQKLQEWRADRHRRTTAVAE